MPLIEELPVTATIRASHGWTYVPDIGAPIAAVQLNSRKRGRDGATIARRAAHSSAHVLTPKQEKAIHQRLNDLNKENYRETNIPIPKREGGKANEKKQSQNVKRILAYSRTFQHYLANEEAGINVYGAAGNLPSSSVRSTAQTAQTPQKVAVDSRRKSAATATINPTQKAGTRRASSLRHSRTAPLKTEHVTGIGNADVEMTDILPQQPSQPSSPTVSQKSPSSSRQKQQAQPRSPSIAQTPLPSYDPALDRDPLLRTQDIPKMPSERVMQALLAEPPLSYMAARAKPLDDPITESGSGSGFTMRTGNSTMMAKPGRWFCAVCGYWGKVRCKYGCGERVCGLLECWKGHEGVCPLAATAY